MQLRIETPTSVDGNWPNNIRNARRKRRTLGECIPQTVNHEGNSVRMAEATCSELYNPGNWGVGEDCWKRETQTRKKSEYSGTLIFLFCIICAKNI